MNGIKLLGRRFAIALGVVLLLAVVSIVVGRSASADPDQKGDANTYHSVQVLGTKAKAHYTVWGTRRAASVNTDWIPYGFTQPGTHKFRWIGHIQLHATWWINGPGNSIMHERLDAAINTKETGQWGLSGALRTGTVGSDYGGPELKDCHAKHVQHSEPPGKHMTSGGTFCTESDVKHVHHVMSMTFIMLMVTKYYSPVAWHCLMLSPVVYDVGKHHYTFGHATNLPGDPQSQVVCHGAYARPAGDPVWIG